MMVRLLALHFAFVLSLFSFDTPLSDEAVREAYFLGQRHDESLLHFFDRYSRHFPIPKTGPHISSISLLTPYAEFVDSSSRHVGAYSAQQALLDYRAHPEIVKVVVEIRLTDAYSQFVPASGSANSAIPTPRPHNFWKDFQVQVSAGDRVLAPATFHGHAISACGKVGCNLTGAKLELQFPAGSFSSDSITVDVTPPEGAPVSANFQTSALR